MRPRPHHNGHGRVRFIPQISHAALVRTGRLFRRGDLVAAATALILLVCLTGILQLLMSAYIVVHQLPDRGGEGGAGLDSTNRRSMSAASTKQHTLKKLQPQLPGELYKFSGHRPKNTTFTEQQSLSRYEKNNRGLHRPRNITLIVETKGELGNHLNSLAHGLRIKHWIESAYPHLTVLLQAEHRDNHKWFIPAATLSQCFPVLRDNMEIWQGGSWMREPINTHNLRRFRVAKMHKLLAKNLSIDEYIYNASRYDHMAELQEEWLRTHGLDQNTTLDMDNCASPGGRARKFSACWESTLEVVLQMHQEQDAWVAAQNGSSERFSVDLSLLPPEPPYPETEPPLKYVSLPFLRTAAWSFGVPFQGEYYELVRKWFAMNESDPMCCPPPHELPGPDEIVWHFRNFRGESELLVEQGFVEVSPAQAVKCLFEPLAAQLPENSKANPIKIAMLSRFPSDLKPYASALNWSPYHFQVRIIENGTVASDFCFLKNARRSLYAVHLSSFAGWAEILGRAPVHLYVVNDTNTNNRATRLKKSFMESVGRMGWIRENPRFSLSILPPRHYVLCSDESGDG
jgi:hypothetical protein